MTTFKLHLTGTNDNLGPLLLTARELRAWGLQLTWVPTSFPGRLWIAFDRDTFVGLLRKS